MGHIRYLLYALVTAVACAVYYANREIDALAIALGLVAFALCWTFMLEARGRARAESWLHDVTESVPAAVFRLRRYGDGRLRYEFVSENSREVRGVSREEAMRDARSVFANVVDEDRGRVLHTVQDASMTLRPFEHQYRIRDAGGRVRWILSSAKPRAEPDGSVLWHGYWSDVTVRRELEAELVRSKERAEEASRAKSLFLAAMSHEIRTPMTGVLGMIELLSLADLAAEQHQAVGIIRESSIALLRIIDDVLDWSRIEAGKLELRMAPAPLECIAGRVADLYAALAANKGLRLERSVDPALHDHYLVDDVRVQQILANLASNAIKFTDHGEIVMAIKLLARGPGKDTVAFEVSDTGPGIAAAEQARLFAPYTQAGDPASRNHGSGLGLTICRRLAELMGGSLGLESDPGRGTLVRLVLPLERAAHAGGAKRDAAFARTATAVQGRPKVLVVDDDAVTRIVLERQLAILGYAPETAASAHEALARCRGGSFAAALVDCNMPGLDGYQFTRLVRAREGREGLARMPVIAFTGRVFREDIDACHAAGMDDHVSKPADLGRLRDVMHRWTSATGDGAARA
ncbi:MAG TPA: ATP-binding protein [Usitatibacter sp.]|nr:ATP-binding protein [Usitatibacter sp.]